MWDLSSAFIVSKLCDCEIEYGFETLNFGCTDQEAAVNEEERPPLYEGRAEGEDARVGQEGARRAPGQKLLGRVADVDRDRRPLLREVHWGERVRGREAIE